MPRVSVITVVKADAPGLRTTHESLIEQTFKDWELLIIANSEQGETLDTALEIQANDFRIHFLGQRSTGIYGAMNEGIESAVGEFIWFMNAGDTFASNTVLAHAVDELSKSSVGLLIGGFRIVNETKNLTFSYPEGRVTEIEFAFNRRGGCHQAMIFRTQFLKDVGGYDTAYSLASDFDLILKVIKETEARRVSEIYAEIEPGGRADQGIFLVHKEKHLIRKNHFGRVSIFIASLIWTGLARTKIVLRGLLQILLCISRVNTYHK